VIAKLPQRSINCHCQRQRC